MTLVQSKEFVLEAIKWRRLLIVSADFEHIEFSIVSAPVRARTRKLRARWTAEEDQDIEVVVDESAEDA